jgi:hypothetical protein
MLASAVHLTDDAASEVAASEVAASEVAASEVATARHTILGKRMAASDLESEDKARRRCTRQAPCNPVPDDDEEEWGALDATTVAVCVQRLKAVCSADDDLARAMLEVRRMRIGRRRHNSRNRVVFKHPLFMPAIIRAAAATGWYIPSVPMDGWTDEPRTVTGYTPAARALVLAVRSGGPAPTEALVEESSIDDGESA